KLFKQIQDFIEMRRVSLKGDRIVVFYNDPEKFNHEYAHYAAAYELAGDTAGDGDVTVVIQPAMLVACETYQGTYSEIRKTYDQLLAWIREKGYRISGPAREFFLSGFGPEGAGDAAVGMVEIQIPIERSGA
ncbi:GyrI-like domain-containing protein, partial [bacterium]|nr:GyrI-like domain-containing protein [bacterium]